VKGPQFNSLHLMFMTQYTEQWNALDLIAERIRALGYPAPGTYKEFVKLASIKEVEDVPGATDMIRHLVSAQEATARTARKLFPVADAANDRPTADLLTQRLEVHEEKAWMPRSLLEECPSPLTCRSGGRWLGGTILHHARPPARDGVN
jgi:starvation-inducible DNA-binding protein